MAEDNKMKAIKKFIETCPYLKNGKINVDYLKDKLNSYSININPIDPIVKRYSDGGAMKQIAFDFCMQFPIGSVALYNLENSKFCDDFMEWIETQNKNRNLPDIKGVQKISCTSPRLCTGKNRNNGNLYNTNELSIL